MEVTSPFMRPCQCRSVRGVDEFELLQKLLPLDNKYSYSICDFLPSTPKEKFSCRFRLNVTNKDDLMEWVNKFSEKSLTTFVIDKTYPPKIISKSSSKVIFKVALRCHHNTKPRNGTKKPSAKHTDCPATATLTVKDVHMRKGYRSRDFHLPTHPAMIVLHHVHNHELNSVEVFRYRKPNNQLEEKFARLFSTGIQPPEALRKHMIDLKRESGDDYNVLVADRSVCPDLAWVWRVYYKEYKKNSKETSTLECMNKLIDEYNIECGEICGLFRPIEKDFVIAIASPLMKRALKILPSAAEVLFCDSFGNISIFGYKVLVLICHSCVGGIPVGILVVSSESEQVLHAALALYKTFLDEESFLGRGLNGPVAIMTDDSPLEINCFADHFPRSNVLISAFHILKATWKHLCVSKSQVPLQQRKQFYTIVKDMVYAPDPTKLDEIYMSTINSPQMKLFLAFPDYLKALYARRHEWAICMHDNLLKMNFDVSNFCEVAVQALKDKISPRIKTHSILEDAITFLTTDFNNFYTSKMIDAANGKSKENIKTFTAEQLHPLQCLSSHDLHWYEIHDSTLAQTFLANMHSGLCSCPIGISGRLCRHQYYIRKTYGVDATPPLPADPESKKMLFYVATGNTEITGRLVPVSTRKVKRAKRNNVACKPVEVAASDDTILNYHFDDEIYAATEVIVVELHSDQIMCEDDQSACENDRITCENDQDTCENEPIPCEEIGASIKTEVIDETVDDENVVDEGVISDEIPANTLKEETLTAFQDMCNDIWKRAETNAEFLQSLFQCVQRYSGLTEEEVTTAIASFGVPTTHTEILLETAAPGHPAFPEIVYSKPVRGTLEFEHMYSTTSIDESVLPKRRKLLAARCLPAP